MAHSTAHLAAVVLLLAVTSAKDQSRWSRQISSYTADISDWVPLSAPVEREPPFPPIKRQAVAEPRILSEQFISRPTSFDAFPSKAYFNAPANRQMYLQSVPSVPSAPQNYLTEQGFGQSIRFGLQQPSFPLSQGFVSPQQGFGSPQFGYDNLPQNSPQLKPRPQPVKMENFAKLPQPVQQTNFNQVPVLKPFNLQAKKPEAPKFVDGYRAENSSNEFFKKKPQSLQKIKFENYEKPKVEQQSSPKTEREEVQLLYVPLESLNRGQFNFNKGLQSNTQLIDMESFYSQGAQRPIKAPEVLPIQKPVNNFSGQNYYANVNSQNKELDQVPKFSTLSSPFPTLPPVTAKPKKLKPHQPPLAIFLAEEQGINQVKVGDVLNSLKHASSVPVLDSVNPLNAPKVFIGPSTLQPLDRYVKFELPYLSNIENSDKKLRQLPFFVAPLSYNTPQGFAKIPFPSPHVGSVVINSQIKDTKPAVNNLQPNYYTGAYRPEQKQPAPQAPVTHKPTVSYYSTAGPPTNNLNTQSNYYSFEPQTVSTFKPLQTSQEDAAPGSYFDSRYNFPQNNYDVQEPAKPYVPRKESTTTQKAITTTTKPPTTYPSQLLETHNPYSINQAFHFSTPLDYHSYYEDYKEQKPAATPGATSTQAPLKLSTTTARVEELITQKTYQQQTPNYIQNYSPEIHYETDTQNRYPNYNNEYNTKVEAAEPYKPIKNENFAEVNPSQYTETQEVQTQANENIPQDVKIPTVYEGDQQKYDQYQTSYEEESKTSTSTTTTTRRPLRQRTRTRYTTTPKTDSSEYSTRATTRRPLRERRPVQTKRYETNRITTEKPTRKPIDYSSSETTTKSTRTRTRGRVTFRPNDSELKENKKSHAKKDQDIAYQRDVLHQNYPVTIQERMSTVDIEAMTEPSIKISTKILEYATETYDTENAYTNEKLHSVNLFNSDSSSVEDIPLFPAKSTITLPEHETTYVPRLSSTRNEEYILTKSSVAPESYVTVTEKEDKQTTVRKEEPVYATESVSLIEANGPSYTLNDFIRDETTTTEPEITTVTSVEEEENIVQTTPSYNRVRVRPGGIRQYHQSSSESPRVKIERRRPVTYRPAFDKRRTTMRIDEIEADLKTKQVRGRQDNNDYKHPVYKPEPTTEATTQELSTKRGQYRRRRPSYTYSSTSTESSERATSKNKYEVKNRFRGRRPTTEKPTEKPDEQDEVTTTRPLHSRYSHRPRLSERYNKKPVDQEEETVDQEPNYSFNRPKYTEPDSDIWSDLGSFKPYNPNNIVDDQKFATTERRSDRGDLDIITARNEFEDILISVTPATNNRNNKKIPDIPPTLEALVEQSKVTQSAASDNMSTFETMLEEVMKSLEEQDEDEYSSNVMKHKGGEIGEIPPERIITSGDTKTTPIQQEPTTVQPKSADDASQSNEYVSGSNHRRGFWKKVKVRPVSEGIETAESQYYHSKVNRFGLPLRQSHEKTSYEKPRISITTYKPLIKDIFSSEDETANDELIDISKVTTKENNEEKTTVQETRTETYSSSSDIDIGTGTPEYPIDGILNFPTEPAMEDKKDKFSFMDYLFGVTSEDDQTEAVAINKTETATTKAVDVEITTDAKPKTEIPTESSFVPEEITEGVTENVEKQETTIKIKVESPKVEETTKSDFMNVNSMSTVMSTEVSHETEICFRGKCIKTSNDIL